MFRPTDFAKLFYRFFAKPRTEYILAEIIASMSRVKPVHVLQVGANDGVLFDPIHTTLLHRRNVTATRIEPIHEYFEELQKNCSPYASQVELFNVCITEADGVVNLYFPDPNLVRHCGDKGHGSINPEFVGRSREGLITRPVVGKSFQSLMQEMRSPRADVYISDCEGYDIDLLEKLPIKELGIKVIFIEVVQQSMTTTNLSDALKRATDVVIANGFNRVVWDGSDFLSWRAPRESSSQYPEIEGFIRD